MGTHASNIDQFDTRSQIAPNLPSPAIGPDATPADYLRAAQQALQAGRTGEAQQALEMAETRLLDRSVPMGQGSVPDQNPAVGQISQALRALAAGNRAETMQLIQAAIPAVMASAQYALGRSVAGRGGPATERPARLTRHLPLGLIRPKFLDGSPAPHGDQGQDQAQVERLGREHQDHRLRRPDCRRGSNRPV
jgi:hypothetical protein